MVADIERGTGPLATNSEIITAPQVPAAVEAARETMREGLHITYDHVNLRSLDEDDREGLAYLLYKELYEPIFTEGYGDYAVEEFDRFTRMFHNPHAVLIIALTQAEPSTIVGFAIGIPGKDCDVTEDDVVSSDSGMLPMPDDKTFYLGYMVRHPDYKKQKLGSGIWKTLIDVVFIHGGWEKLCLYAQLKRQQNFSPMFQSIRANKWIGFDELQSNKNAMYGTIADDSGTPTWQYVYMDLRSRISQPLVVPGQS